jgi:DNA polymerase V
MLLDLQPDSISQGELDLGDDDSLEDIADKARLMSALDAINKRYGRGTMKMASAGLDGDRRVWSMRQERRTPAYTTNWADIPIARA